MANEEYYLHINRRITEEEKRNITHKFERIRLLCENDDEAKTNANELLSKLYKCYEDVQVIYLKKTIDDAKTVTIQLEDKDEKK